MPNSNKIFLGHLYWGLICLLVLLGRQGVSAQASATPTTTPGAYTRLSNVFCLQFSGDTCTSCDTSLEYYLYGNECSKFQERSTDYVQTGASPEILRGT